MYKELTEEELDFRLTLVDKRLNGGITDARDILKFVHTCFPLEYVMPVKFNGTHVITLKEDGKPQE